MLIPKSFRGGGLPSARAAACTFAVGVVAAVAVPAHLGAQVSVGTTPVTAVAPISVTGATVIPQPLPPEGTPTSGPVPVSVGSGDGSAIAPTAAPTTSSTSPSGPTTTLAKGATTKPAPTTTTIPATPEALRAALSQTMVKAGATSVSVLITVDRLGVVLERNPDQPGLPASTNKIYVAGAALLRLGPNYRFVTEVRSTAEPSGGVLAGDLVVVAGGDPSLAAKDLGALADTLRAAGLTQVSGELVIDDSRHADKVVLDGWKASFSGGEVGRLSAFVVDENKGLGTDPSLANLAAFRKILLKRGITVVGSDRRGRVGGSGVVLASHKSAPLTQIVSTMAKKSNNTYAETLLREVGAADGQPSTAGGVAVVRAYATRLGAMPPVMADGSGLSSLNRTTSRSEVAWLQGLATTGAAGDFLHALPIACVDGTLRSRMCQTAAAGRTSAKTGYLTGTTALSGYTTTTGGRNVTFSFLMNGVTSTLEARVAIDTALAIVCSYTN